MDWLASEMNVPRDFPFSARCLVVAHDKAIRDGS